MKSYSIEPADASGVALLNHLQGLILPDDRPADHRIGLWWVVEEDGQPAGFCGVHPSVQWGDTLYLCRAGVREEFRGRGLQRKMIQLRERAARRLGFRWLISDTTDNPASANSLIGCGFKTFTPSRPWGWKHTIYWRKEL